MMGIREFEVGQNRREKGWVDWRAVLALLGLWSIVWSDVLSAFFVYSAN